MPGPRRLLTRILARSRKTAAQFTRVIDYAAAGTVSLDDFKKNIRAEWQDYADDEAEMTAGLMTWEEDLFAPFLVPGASVLIVGCGSGRDLLALAERGCRVTGVDPAGVALAAARRLLEQRRQSATLIEGFFEDAPLTGRFDAAIFSFYAYTYIPQSARRVAALRKAAALLKSDGCIVISHSRGRRPRPVLISTARAAAAVCRTDWRLEPGDVVAITPANAFTYRHEFEPGEIEREASAADLQVVARREFRHETGIVLRRSARGVIQTVDPSPAE
jgi:SAM-dependent methyltransferase